MYLFSLLNAVRHSEVASFLDNSGHILVICVQHVEYDVLTNGSPRTSGGGESNVTAIEATMIFL